MRGRERMMMNRKKVLSLALFLLLSAIPLMAGELVLSTANPDWAFDNGSAEFPPGAQGSLTPGNDFLRLDGNFGRGGRYTAATLVMNLPASDTLRFRVRTPASRLVMQLRLTDGTLRKVEESLSGGAPDFRELSIPLDGKALASIHFFLRQNDLSTDDGFLEIAGIRLLGVSGANMVTVSRAESPVSHFVAPNDGALRLAVLVGKEIFQADDLRYRLLDYSGAEAFAGSASFDSSLRVITVPAPEKAGYYRVSFPASGIESAMIADAPYSGRMDEFFGMDLPREISDPAGWMKLLRRNGISWARNRLPWPDGQENAHYDALRLAAADESVAILDTFETGSARETAAGNLVDIARHFADAVSRPGNGKAVELGDVPKANMTPEFEVALLRAVSFRFGLDRIPTTLVGGLGALRPEDRKLVIYRMYVAAGLLDDMVALSARFPEPITELEERITRVRAVEKEIRGARVGFPHWVSGTEESVAQQSARVVELRALGAAKFFLPVAGMFEDRVPGPRLGAYTHLTRVLAHKEYVGDLAMEGATRARVFSDGGETVICLYAAEKPETFLLPNELKIRSATGIDGRPLIVRDGTVSLMDGMVYLYPETEGLLEQLDTETAAMELRKLVRNFKPESRRTRPVVMQPDYDPGAMICEPAGSRIRCGDKVRFRVYFSNISDQTATVEPALNLPGGARRILEPEEDDKKKIELLPGAKMEHWFQMQFDPMLATRSYLLPLVADRANKAITMGFSVNPYHRKVVSVPRSGNPSEWIDFSSTFNWESDRELPVDVRAKFRVVVLEGGLRFELEVRDPRHEVGDGVELLLQLRRTPDDFGTEPLRFRSSDSRLNASGKSQPNSLIFQRVNDEISRYQFDLLLQDKANINYVGIWLGVESGDETGRKGVLAWGEGGGDQPVPELFQLLEIK